MKRVRPRGEAWVWRVLLLGGAFILSTGCGRREAAPSAPSARPDIVLISLDTVRADRGPGPWGPGVMPNLAAFAATGVRFDQAWAPASNTLVSHGSLFTGQEPWQHDFHPGRKPAAPPTLMVRLREAGYATAVFTALPIWLGKDHGFDAGAQTFRSELVPGATVIDWVRGWMREAPPSPRALFVHLYDAHSDTNVHPYEAPELPREAAAFGGCVGELCASRLLRAVDEGKVALPSGGAEAIRAGYSAGVAATDGLLGELLQVVEPLTREGFVAIFSDHGELLGEEGWLHHGSHPAVLDIPLVVRWPGGPRGVVSAVPVTLTGLYPTVLAVAGRPVPGTVDLRTLIDGPEDRTAVSMNAARRGREAAALTRAGGIAGFRRDGNGRWTAAALDPGLERLAADPSASATTSGQPAPAGGGTRPGSLP